MSSPGSRDVSAQKIRWRSSMTNRVGYVQPGMKLSTNFLLLICRITGVHAFLAFLAALVVAVVPSAAVHPDFLVQLNVRGTLFDIGKQVRASIVPFQAVRVAAVFAGSNVSLTVAATRRLGMRLRIAFIGSWKPAPPRETSHSFRRKQCVRGHLCPLVRPRVVVPAFPRGSLAAGALAGPTSV